MRPQKRVDGRALAGGLAAFVGALLATNTAPASDKDTVDSTAVAIHAVADVTVAQAETANREAAAAAAAGVRRSTRLDLDLRLLGHTSPMIADSR